MLQLTETLHRYGQDFAAIDEQPGLPAWLYPMRRAALSRFTELGFPKRRDEEWRNTPVTPIADTPFRLAEPGRAGRAREALERFSFPGLTGTQLVFLNGHYAPDLSTFRPLPGGALIGSLVEALRSAPSTVEPYLARYASPESEVFTALNTAFLQDGALVLIPRGVVVEEPIHLLYLSDSPSEPTVSHPRSLVVVGENSQVTLVESYAGMEELVYFTNAVTEVVAAQNAMIDHYKLERESRKAFHVATLQGHLARSATFSSHSIAFGGALVRNNVNATLAGEGVECTLNGLYIGAGTQLIDNHTAIDHAMPHCNSHELYKGILDDRARGVFNGKILVRQDAQKTDAKQTNQTLLLSDNAQINTKPQLEIYADDVKCTHGATVGQLDAEAIFYLRSRGVGEQEARNLLTYAFAADVINRIQVEPIRAALNATLAGIEPPGVA